VRRKLFQRPSWHALAASWASRAACTAAGSSTTPEDEGDSRGIVEMLPRVVSLLAATLNPTLAASSWILAASNSAMLSSWPRLLSWGLPMFKVEAARASLKASIRKDTWWRCCVDGGGVLWRWWCQCCGDGGASVVVMVVAWCGFCGGGGGVVFVVVVVVVVVVFPNCVRLSQPCCLRHLRPLVLWRNLLLCMLPGLPSLLLGCAKKGIRTVTSAPLADASVHSPSLILIILSSERFRTAWVIITAIVQRFPAHDELAMCSAYVDLQLLSTGNCHPYHVVHMPISAYTCMPQCSCCSFVCRCMCASPCCQLISPW